jgi:hypothetical protein
VTLVGQGATAEQRFSAQKHKAKTVHDLYRSRGLEGKSNAKKGILEITNNIDGVAVLDMRSRREGVVSHT